MQLRLLRDDDLAAPDDLVCEGRDVGAILLGDEPQMRRKLVQAVGRQFYLEVRADMRVVQLDARLSGQVVLRLGWLIASSGLRGSFDDVESAVIRLLKSSFSVLN